MATTLGFKDIIDLPKWRPNSPALGASAAGVALAWDMRNDATRHSYIYCLRTAAILDAYDPTTDEWMSVANPGLTGTFGAGAGMIFHPTQGPRGALNVAGNTTSKVVLSTALPAAVAINQLANRGDGTGYRIRIIGNGATNSGKVEERTIVANTAGTTPTLWLDTPLSFTPGATNADSYEMLSGRLFMISAGTLAAGSWKYYDVACNVMSGNLSITNLYASGSTDVAMVALSEGYVPNDKTPGQGFLGNITATASGATSITGSAMPADLAADEYRNFQVRVVQDTTTPTAVGQRRRISTHTGGATGAFTVAAWAVTPSATATFVVENDDDKILLVSNTNAIYTYAITGNAWDASTTFGAPGTAGGVGLVFCQAFGTTRDTTNNHRHSLIYRIRGGNVATIDTLDIAGAATGTWAADIAYANKGLTLFNTGTCGAYMPCTFNGRFLMLNLNGTQRMLRFDVRNRTLDTYAYLRFPQGAAVVGGKLAVDLFIDGATKLNALYHLTNTQAQFFSSLVQR